METAAILSSPFHCVAFYKLGQSCEVILQTAAQVQMLPIVFRIVRDFTHEGVTIQKRKERNITKLAMTQRNQPLRKTHSKTGHEKGFLIKKKKKKVLSKAGWRWKA